MQPIVSIIVPCYNVAPYVDACLDSLVNQTLRDIEIICVNDGSTDATPSLLCAWEGRDSRIRVIDQENGGLSVARNTGMAAAAGEYIGFVDPDDYVEHAMYARLLEEARLHDADVTACGYTGFSDRDGSVLAEWTRSADGGVDKDAQASAFHEKALWKRMEVVAWNKLYKKQFLQDCGVLFEPSFRKGEDDVFWLMLLVHAKCLAVIPDRLYWYRKQRDGAISHAWEKSGCPLMLDAERLLHATAYWKKCRWLESGMKRGWVLHFLWYYMLERLIRTNRPFPRLSLEEWALLHDRCREWFALTGGVDRFENLDKWELSFCHLLAGPAERPLPATRFLWRLLSRRRGRCGRYYTLRGFLASCKT